MFLLLCSATAVHIRKSCFEYSLFHSFSFPPRQGQFVSSDLRSLKAKLEHITNAFVLQSLVQVLRRMKKKPQKNKSCFMTTGTYNSWDALWHLKLVFFVVCSGCVCSHNECCYGSCVVQIPVYIRQHLHTLLLAALQHCVSVWSGSPSLWCWNSCLLRGGCLSQEKSFMSGLHCDYRLLSHMDMQGLECAAPYLHTWIMLPLWVIHKLLHLSLPPKVGRDLFSYSSMLSEYLFKRNWN